MSSIDILFRGSVIPANRRRNCCLNRPNLICLERDFSFRQTRLSRHAASVGDLGVVGWRRFVTVVLSLYDRMNQYRLCVESTIDPRAYRTAWVSGQRRFSIRFAFHSHGLIDAMSCALTSYVSRPEEIHRKRLPVLQLGVYSIFLLF